MMQFLRDRHERQFQLAFNRGAIRGDIIYSICLAVFGLSAVHRLRDTPGMGSAVREGTCAGFSSRARCRVLFV